MLRVFAGPNGSGKSTLQSQIGGGRVFVNADVIESRIRYAGSFTLPHGTPTSRIWDFASHHFPAADLSELWTQGSTLGIPRVNSYQASAIAGYLRYQLVDAGIPFDFETVMSSPDKIEFMHYAKSRMEVELHYVCVESLQVNIDRVRARVEKGGHDVPEEKIRERRKRSLALLPKAIEASTRVFLYDNTTTMTPFLTPDGITSTPSWFHVH